jgi:hypothetical protein
MTTPTPTPKLGAPGGYAPDENPKIHYWPEYFALASNDGFTANYPNRFGDVGFHVYKTNGCPRCKHSTSSFFPLTSVAPSKRTGAWHNFTRFIRDFTRFIRGPVVGSKEPFASYSGYLPEEQVFASTEVGPFFALITCNCLYTHEPISSAPAGEKPSGATGCGTYWLMQASKNNNDSMVLDAVPSGTAYKVWTGVQAAAASAASSLSAVQANAGKWQTGMTAILTILVVTTAIGGRDAVSGLPGWGKLVVGLLALIALVSNAWALYRFTAASSGRVQILDNEGVERLDPQSTLRFFLLFLHWAR